MHQALYRKWRPKTFFDVCGQDHITSVLRYEVKEKAVSHAYLFCGTRGTGKTTCAKILAKAVNCEAPVDGNPCLRCAACLAIENGSATDVLEMDAASNNGVETVRDIRDEVVYSPSALRYRVYIVDEVHMLSTSAFNALLKTLEEPPAHVVFILATTELHKLPATIISRCQRFDFRRIASPVLAARVEHIAKEEGLDLAPEAAARIARMAAGGMRDAISLLELCAGARGRITADTVNEMTGSTGRDSVIALVRAIADRDTDTVLATVAEAVASSRDLEVFWQDLMSLYRDLLVFKTTDRAAKYLDLTDAETAELSALAERFRRGQLLSHCKKAEETFLAMKEAGAVKRMLAELALLSLCEPTLNTSVESLLARIETLEDALRGGAALLPREARPTPEKKASEGEAPAVDVTAPRAKEAAQVPSARAAAPKKEAPTPPEEGCRVLHRLRGFVNAVERVRRSNSMLASFLESAKAFSMDGSEKILVQLPNAFARSLLDAEKDRALLAAALAPELQRELDARDLLLEIPEEAPARDTVLDDLLEAAESE